MTKNTESTHSVANEQTGHTFIRFGSHRARDYGFRALNRKPQGYFSLKRKTGPGGVYCVTSADVEKMRAYSCHARFTLVRKPHDDLMECW